MTASHVRPCPHDFPREWLIAWRDGLLHAAQLEVTQAHLATCSDCRGWLRELDAVDHILRAATPFDDDPVARQSIKALVEAAPGPSARRSVFAGGRLVAATLALVCLLAAGLALIDAPAEGGSVFTRWFSSERSPKRRLPEQHVTGTPLYAPAGTVGAATLPMGLAPVAGQVVGGASGTSEQVYRSAEGLAITVVFDRTGRGQISLAEDPMSSQIVGIDGREVLVMFGPSTASVSAASWVEGDALVTMFVLQAPPGGLSLDAALRIVAALLRTEPAEDESS